MAVAAGNPAVLVVDAKLGALPAADRAAAIDGRASGAVTVGSCR